MSSEHSPTVFEPARLAVTHSEKRKRTELVGVRFTAEELTELRGLAAAHGMSVPELLRVSVATVQTLEALRG